MEGKISNNMFRIVETYGKNGNFFRIEKRITTKNTWVHKILGIEPKYKWKILTFEYYGNYVNRQYTFQHRRQTFHSVYGAQIFLNTYIEYLKAEPFEHKGKTFHPMFYYAQNTYSLFWYDKKSYRWGDKHDYGYQTIDKKSILIQNIDEKEAEGKLVKIHM